jgi:two-component system, NtrC family, sensor kinase
VPRRLAQKLVLSLTLIVVVISAISGLITVKTEQRHLLNAMITGADQLSKSITSATWHAMLDDHREAAYEVMQTIGRKQGIDRIRMFNRTGRLVFSTAPEDSGRGADAREKMSVSSSISIFSGRDGRRNLAMVTPIPNEAACSQAACHAHPAAVKVLGVLDLSLNLDSADREISQVKMGVFAVTGIEILLIGIFIFFFTQRFVGVPIQQLIAGTKAVSAMELDKPIDIVHTSEELDHLARSFNTMRERLRLAMDEINQFTAKLETKVAERTEELRAAHQKLRQTDRLASLGPACGQRGARNQQSDFRRAESLDADAADSERRWHSARARAGIPEISLASGAGDVARGPHRFRPAVVLAAVQAAAGRGGSESHREDHFVADIAQAEAGERDGGCGLWRTICRRCVATAQQIQQVVLNLVLNGAEATQSRAERRLAVRTRRAQNGAAVALSVQDNGEGVRPENLSRIFDPFFTTKPEGKGVGLGLAVSYGIVEAHGGDIAVVSKPGEGATFTVTLPVSGNAEEPALAAAGAERA